MLDRHVPFYLVLSSFDILLLKLVFRHLYLPLAILSYKLLPSDPKILFRCRTPSVRIMLGCRLYSQSTATTWYAQSRGEAVFWFEFAPNTTSAEAISMIRYIMYLLIAIWVGSWDFLAYNMSTVVKEMLSYLAAHSEDQASRMSLRNLENLLYNIPLCSK